MSTSTSPANIQGLTPDQLASSLAFATSMNEHILKHGNDTVAEFGNQPTNQPSEQATQSSPSSPPSNPQKPPTTPPPQPADKQSGLDSLRAEMTKGFDELRQTIKSLKK